MEETSVVIAGLKIMEPVSVLTDLMITALCSFLFTRLYNSNRNNNYWPFFFLLMGISTFFGALSHGLREEAGESAFYALWLTMQVIICLANYASQKASLETYFQTHPRKGLFQAACMLQAVVFIALVVIMKAFWVASVGTALALIPIMVLNFSHRSRPAGSGFIAWGIALAFLTAFIHFGKISLHRWFNYKDIAHVLLMVSFYLMYLGIRKPGHMPVSG